MTLSFCHADVSTTGSFFPGNATVIWLGKEKGQRGPFVSQMCHSNAYCVFRSKLYKYGQLKFPSLRLFTLVYNVAHVLNILILCRFSLKIAM